MASRYCMSVIKSVEKQGSLALQDSGSSQCLKLKLPWGRGLRITADLGGQALRRPRGNRRVSGPDRRQSGKGREELQGR